MNSNREGGTGDASLSVCLDIRVDYVLCYETKAGVSMKAGELTKLAKKNGCRVKRHGSEHDIWIDPKTGKTAMIPRHQSKEVAIGTALSIMKDLGLR